MKKVVSLILIVLLLVTSIMVLPVSAAASYAQPKITTIKNVSSGVKLTWDKVKGAAKYRIFFKNGSHWKKLGDTSSTAWIDKTAKDNKSRTYTIRCISKDGKKFTSSYNKKGWTITYRYYSVARTVWNYLINHGLSKANAAGIIGNMMAECGIGTPRMYLQWNKYSKYNRETYYGLCQWNMRYRYSWFNDCSILTQLECIVKELKSTFKNYGNNYKKGFSLSKFTNLSVSESAVAFAACYIRPGYEDNRYYTRRLYANTAYHYFMNN